MSSRRRSARNAPEVIDLVDSSSDDDQPNRQQKQQQQQRQRPGGGAAVEPANQLPRSIPCSPISTATTTSNNPLANLLAANSKPGSVRPPPSRKAKPTTTRRAGAAVKKTTTTTVPKEKPAAKRKNALEKAGLDDDLDLIDSPEEQRHGLAAGGTGAGNTSTEMWSLKYEPRVPEALIVHKKKVEEVKLWLEIQLHAAGSRAPLAGTSKLLIVTGPPGCGKTATLRTLGESLGFTITEWQAQAEASYQEISYLNNNSTATGGDGTTNNRTSLRFEDRLQYVSKIGAFEEFASRAKMPSLPLNKPTIPTNLDPTPFITIKKQNGTGSGTANHPQKSVPVPAQQQQQQQQHLPPTMVFIDDLPYTSDLEQRRRLARALSDLARCARFPVVLFATEASGRSQQQQDHRAEKISSGGLPKELANALEHVPGVATISFNPVTALNTAKVLRNILEKENRATQFPDSQLVALAEQAGGDLRNAINSLQFACTGIKPVIPQHLASQKSAAKRQKGAAAAKTKNRKAAAPTEDDVEAVSFMLRDTSLSLFHGLGKLLYNKRLPIGAINNINNDGDGGGDDQNEGQLPCPSRAAPAAPAPSTALAALTHAAANTPAVPCSPWLQRRPMDGFNPDDVLSASGLEANSVNAFLHENIPRFIQDSEILDLAACLSQLSTADVISSCGRRRRTDALEAGDDAPGGATIADACAALVAARGVCFWNTHPAPRQWQPLRAPALFTVQRGISINSEQLHDAAGVGRVVYGGSGGLDSASLLATELLPAVRSVCQNIRAPYIAPISLVYQQPAKWTRIWNEKLHEMVLHGGVGGRGAVIEVDSIRNGGALRGGGGSGVGGGITNIEEDPIEDSDDDHT